MIDKRKLGYIPFSEHIITKKEITKMFDELREEINEKFENVEKIEDPEPETAYGLLGIQNKLVNNMNQLASIPDLVNASLAVTA